MLDPQLKLHAVVIILLLIAFKLGYIKKERDIIKKQNREYEEEQSKLPRAQR